MSKKFYTHLVDIEPLILELDSLQLSDKEKVHLASLVDANLHHAILDTILSELSEEDKKIFLPLLQEDSHDKIWNYLNNKTIDIEKKIKKVAKELREELHKDVKETKLRVKGGK